jgi:hypothetical protein
MWPDIIEVCQDIGREETVEQLSGRAPIRASFHEIRKAG